MPVPLKYNNFIRNSVNTIIKYIASFDKYNDSKIICVVLLFYEVFTTLESRNKCKQTSSWIFMKYIDFQLNENHVTIMWLSH
jgi:hypothetical protein